MPQDSLHERVNDIAALIDDPVLDHSQVEEKIIKLLDVTRAHALEELSDPIESVEDFDKRLAQIKRAYKRGRFNSDLKAATQNLSDYLWSVEEKEQANYLSLIHI